MNSKELSLSYDTEKLKGKIAIALKSLEQINADLFQVDLDDGTDLDVVGEQLSQVRSDVRDLKDFLQYNI